MSEPNLTPEGRIAFVRGYLEGAFKTARELKVCITLVSGCDLALEVEGNEYAYHGGEPDTM